MLTSAHTAIVRRRRAMRMVAALIMGAAIRPRGSSVKPKHEGRRNRAALTQIRESRQITGLHGAGTSR
jgi:hypothetical protein